MNRPLARGLTLSLALLAGQVAAPARAWADSGADAADKKAQGDAAFDRKRFAEALEHYQLALAKGGDARLHYNIAQVLSSLGRFPEALVSYQKFLANAPPGILDEERQKLLFKLIDEVKGRVARIELRCDVEGARVLVRGTEAGTIPLREALSVNAGRAKVEIIAEGYRPFEATVDLPGGGATTVEAKLERVDFSGTLVVRTNVDGATILVDGESRGASPVTLRLPQGPHTIVARAPDYLDQSGSATLEPGQKQEVSLSLRRAPSHTLAYLGLGVAAAGIGIGTATGIAAYSKFKKDDCDSTTKLCGPASHSDLATSKLYGNISTVSFAVGGAGLALGVYGWLRARGEAKEPKVGLGVGPGQILAEGHF